jgi:hypothetical protein
MDSTPDFGRTREMFATLKEIEQGNKTENDLKCDDMGYQEAKRVAKALKHNHTGTEMNLFGSSAIVKIRSYLMMTHFMRLYGFTIRFR